MSLRISEITEGAGTTLRVDGRLRGDAVWELWRASAHAVRPLTLELSGLLFADAEGVRTLTQLRVGGAKLRNIPPYVSLLLGMPPTPRAPGARRATEGKSGT
jgi:hypothetical protein